MNACQFASGRHTRRMIDVTAINKVRPVTLRSKDINSSDSLTVKVFVMFKIWRFFFHFTEKLP